jgi:CheY-like chemotaxis protein
MTGFADIALLGVAAVLGALAATFALRALRRRPSTEAPPSNLDLAHLAARVGDEIGNPLGYVLQNLQHVRDLLHARTGNLPRSGHDALRDAIFGVNRAADNVRRLRERTVAPKPGPAALDETDPLLGQTADDQPCGQGHILVVDDDEMVGYAVRRGLEHAYVVDVVLSGEAALERIGRLEYDLVLSDLWMPQMSGMELYARVRERKPPLAERFIFMTGSAADPRAQAFLSSIPNPCLFKPCGLSDLRDAVQARLGSSRRKGSVGERPRPVAEKPRAPRLAVVSSQ